MDIILHAQSKDLLFKYYRVLRLIFNDVIGHLEVDYLSIALLNKKNELCFVSSMPSIEQNLIAHDLWQQDQACLFNNHDILIWPDIYLDNELRRYKMSIPKIEYAISIPSAHQSFKVNYSFGLKTADPLTHTALLANIDILVSMGKYTLSKILKVIEVDIQNNKPNLQLIVNQ